jgi:hypothetical protein
MSVSGYFFWPLLGQWWGSIIVTLGLLALGCLALGIVIALLFKRSHCADRNQNHLLVLHHSGAVDCQQGTDFNIHPNSRIGWFGCWLTLKQHSNRVDFVSTDKQIASQFVYRDSVSASDYSRLCRQILKATTLTNTN